MVSTNSAAQREPAATVALTWKAPSECPTGEQVLEDAQAAALGLFTNIHLAGEQPVVLPRLPIGLSLTPPEPQGPPPRVGEHGRSILHEAGYSDSEIEELIRIGALA